MKEGVCACHHPKRPTLQQASEVQGPVKMDVHCGRNQPRSKMVFAAVLNFTGIDNRLCNFFEPGVARIHLRSA